MYYDSTIMMARTQITLPPEEHRRARARAAELGLSLAEYLRRLVAADLARDERDGAGIETIFNLGRGGESDVARHKDDYVAAAVEAEYRGEASRR
jgi:hypothetical protein